MSVEVCKESFRRDDVIHHLNLNLKDRNLLQLAKEQGISIWYGSRKNKGWVGQTVEKIAGLKLNSSTERDGDDFELKTTELVEKKGVLVPKETLKITQLNPANLLEEQFENSQLWRKLERLILIGYFSQTLDCVVAKRVLSVTLTNQSWVGQVKEFWEDVQNLVCSGEIKSAINLGSSQSLIQLRPLGDGKQMSQCPITGEHFPSRAFYATKKLITLLMTEASLEVSQ